MVRAVSSLLCLPSSDGNSRGTKEEMEGVKETKGEYVGREDTIGRGRNGGDNDNKERSTSKNVGRERLENITAQRRRNLLQTMGDSIKPVCGRDLSIPLLGGRAVMHTTV